MIGTIIGMIIIGAIAGFLARALVPGKDSMSIPATILLGIVGSFVGGFLASLLFRGEMTWNFQTFQKAGVAGRDGRRQPVGDRSRHREERGSTR